MISFPKHFGFFQKILPICKLKVPPCTRIAKFVFYILFSDMKWWNVRSDLVKFVVITTLAQLVKFSFCISVVSAGVCLNQTYIQVNMANISTGGSKLTNSPDIQTDNIPISSPIDFLHFTIFSALWRSLMQWHLGESQDKKNIKIF